MIMIKHIVMFKFKATEGMSEYDNALEAKKRFEDVIANVKELKRASLLLTPQTLPKAITQLLLPVILTI